MKQRLTLIERIELAWREWNDAIAGLDDADFERMVYRQWNLKDVTGHVFAYLDLALRHVESYKKRKRLASPRAPSYSYFNRREAERLRGVPLARLRADIDAAHRELRALVLDDIDPSIQGPRGIKVHGRAEIVEREGHFGAAKYFRITPERSWSWGIERAAFENGKPVYNLDFRTLGVLGHNYMQSVF
jgi:hypothetical protein